MTNFDNLDISTGAVLDRDDAIEFLKQAAYENFKNVMNDDDELEALPDIIDDIKGMIKAIEIHPEYEYIKLYEHPMAASNIDIIFMEEVKQ